MTNFKSRDSLINANDRKVIKKRLGKRNLKG